MILRDHTTVIAVKLTVEAIVSEVDKNPLLWRVHMSIIPMK